MLSSFTLRHCPRLVSSGLPSGPDLVAARHDAPSRHAPGLPGRWLRHAAPLPWCPALPSNRAVARGGLAAAAIMAALRPGAFLLLLLFFLLLPPPLRAEEPSPEPPAPPEDRAAAGERLRSRPVPVTDGGCAAGRGPLSTGLGLREAPLLAWALGSPPVPTAAARGWEKPARQLPAVCSASLFQPQNSLRKAASPTPCTLFGSSQHAQSYKLALRAQWVHLPAQHPAQSLQGRAWPRRGAPSSPRVCPESSAHTPSWVHQAVCTKTPGSADI